MKKTLLSCSLLCSVFLTAQTLTGTFTQHAGQQLSLSGFDHFKTIQLAATTVDSLGNFTLNYPKEYQGMGVLTTQDNSSLVLMLTEPNVQLSGTHLQDPNGLSFSNHTANTNFVQYAKAQGLRKNAMSALKFLEDLYQKEPLFTHRKKLQEAIKKEQAYLLKEEAAFIAQLEPQSFLRWYIPYRTLVQDMPGIVRMETHRIPEAIAQFRTTDFNHPNFRTSGLFKELIEGHYLLLENMGQALDSVYTQMNLSTQYLIDHLQGNEQLLNSVSNALFNHLEARSLFKASAYLSTTLLNNSQCVLEDDLANKLESYRTMKVGNIAPDITLEKQKLSAIQSTKLVVFGASWCPHCKSEAVQLAQQYDAWKAKNIAIVYISIDTDPTALQTAYANAPWHVYCDFKGWNTPAAKAYHITGTPSYFLLDKDNKILARPNNVEHAKAIITHTL